MMVTLEIPAEAQSRLDAAAQEKGQATEEYVRESFRIWLILTTPDTEESEFEDMRALSLPTLEELWINEHDAVYDTL